MNLQELIDRLVRDPLVRRYGAELQAAMEASTPFRNTLPWHAMGERNFRALEILTMVDRGIKLTFIMSEEFPLLIVQRLLLADPYLWSSYCLQIADDAPIPSFVVEPSLLRKPIEFFSYENAFGDLDRGDEAENNWALLSDEKSHNALGIVLDAHTARQEDSRLQPIFLEYGKRFPDDYEWGDDTNPRAIAAITRVLKFCAFLNSPYINTESHRLPRAIRREDAYRGKPEADRETHVVVLREETKQAVDSEREAGVSDRAYHYRWWVKGHYRWQWYPSLGSHRLIWIRPFLKGPDNAPPIEKIYAVTR